MSLRSVKGTVMYLAANSYMALRYEGAAVIVTRSLISREFLPDDIIEFDADPLQSREAHMYLDTGLKAKWKATRIKFVKHAQTIEGIGKVLNIDHAGEFCFIEYAHQGNKYNIFCTRINFKPAVPNINQSFKTGDNIRFVAKEQAPALKNNVKWKTVAATDLKHSLVNRAMGRNANWDAVPMATTPAGTPKAAPRSVAPPAPTFQAPPIPAMDIATKARTITTASGAPLTVAAVVSGAAKASDIVEAAAKVDQVKSDNRVSRDDQLSGRSGSTSTTSDSASLSSSRVSSPVISAPNVNLATNGNPVIVPPTVNTTPHPLASYDWMKYDLVNILTKDKPSSSNDKLEEEHRKLCTLAHQVNGTDTCIFCMSR